MLGFLKRSARGPAVAPPAALPASAEPPAAADRLIFRYTVNGVTRALDPVLVDLRLEEAGTADWHKLVATVAQLREPPSTLFAAAMGEAGVRDRRERFHAALKELVRVVRFAFRGTLADPLPELDEAGNGVSAADCMTILTQYLAFGQRLQEDERPF